jgi:hypothetical protein
MMMVLVLSISGCAVNIADFRFCGLNPNTGNWACDNFLTNDPATLNPTDFITWEQSVESSGQVIEVTTSNAIGSIKTELEQLCTKTSCTYPTQQALKKAIKELDFRVDGVKRRSLAK